MPTFTKAERLSSKVAIDKLFETGKSFHNTPFKVFWLETAIGNSPVQIVISVPKRIYKRAVDRNKVKRLIREAYRKNKDTFYEKLNNKKISLMFIYTFKLIINYKEMEEKVVQTLQRLSKNINSEPGV
jgi:ribonuclease P protein component